MGIGVWQVVIILVIVVIIFGAGKLPHVMGDVAKGIKNFKKGMAEDETEDGKTIEGSQTAEASSPSTGPGAAPKVAPTAAKAEKAEVENK